MTEYEDYIFQRDGGGTQVEIIPAIRYYDIIFTSEKGWVMKILAKTGEILINPDIPQDEAVHLFIEALNNAIRNGAIHA